MAGSDDRTTGKSVWRRHLPSGGDASFSSAIWRGKRGRRQPCEPDCKKTERIALSVDAKIVAAARPGSLTR